MTIQIKARDLGLAVLLLALGVVVGLTFRAAPSEAQSVPAGSGYVQSGGVMYYCQQRECYAVILRQF
ncbi:MAG: hypothetical protein KJ676_07225 [Alphaproteobacteria bacterium]|nr:hypothetical protein [Alphaproteobacteria bacterium]MBU1526297.1 hypothetical protein [Alphaproteobacteria bacterium]MBU2116101.1 hypothetical protein [Alphaproteobacteria bacterium]MBU2351454.1 hypothetical protein [Alphaproteobacteria bacterium]MBU2382791.1 hypothetical protein [Alphaproteobacteria bacterium]